MIGILLWVLGCYALAVIAVHAAFRYTRGQKRNIKQYVLLSGNEQQRMEWYLRSISRHAHDTGQEIEVIVVDHHSGDQTMDIVKCFRRNRAGVTISSEPPRWMEEGSAFRLKNGITYRRVNESEVWLRQGASTGYSELRPRSRKRNRANLRKWKRFQMAAIPVKRNGEGRLRSLIITRAKISISKSDSEYTPLIWRMQASGHITRPDHAILVDLRDPAELSKLPL